MKSTFIRGAIALAWLCLLLSCRRDVLTAQLKTNAQKKQSLITSSTGLICTAQPEQTNYQIYRMCGDGTHIGDVMPYFDSAANNFKVFYLKDIWNDATSQHHPWYGFQSTDFSSYSEMTGGELLSSSPNGCDQDYSVGTGSVIKKGLTYYEFYSGHNPNYPSSCVTHAEGIMLATSSGLNQAYTKNTSFTTIYPPTGQGFDETNNFRDPYVFYDSGSAKYYMLVAARKNVNGTWRGVIIDYISTDLLNWSYDTVIYDGGAINYFMMETPQEIKIGSTYYLVFSDTNTKHYLYRKSSTLNGPWGYPVGYDRFEGNGMYAAKIASDNTGKNYIFGWTNVLQNNVDTGAWQWGGNLVAHRLTQESNGDLSIAMPSAVRSYLENSVYTISVNSQWGNVTNTIPGTNSYHIISTADMNVSNVIFDPVALDRYKISAIVNYASSAKDFGFMIGACDGYNNFYSLRFVPSQNRFSFDKVNRSNLTTTTAPANDVPITLSPNTNYNVDIVVENSMVVVYINNKVALSSRIYKARRTNWGIFTDNSDVTFNYIDVKYHP